MLNIENDEINHSISLFLKTTRNMYLWDIQYKLWHERVATNSKLYRMNISENDNCEYCQQIETNVHAFIWCERSQLFWREIKYFFIKIRIPKFQTRT